MNQPIIGFDLDEEGHWRAKLACGHYQHVRHDPPLVRREWVLSEQGRAGHIGMSLNCLRCDAGEPPTFVVGPNTGGR